VTSRVPRSIARVADGWPLSSAIACALLAACATSSEPAAPAVVRTRAPVAYEKTIDNYLAFRLRNPAKNTRIHVAPPEPGDCPLDGTPQSIRGWVVQVTHETYSGDPSGKDAIRITAKPYWFWFSGDTIAGISPRADLCPGIVSAFDDLGRPRAAVTIAQPSTTPARVESTEPSTPPAPAKPSPAKSAKKKKATSAKKGSTATKPQQAAAKPSQ